MARNDQAPDNLEQDLSATEITREQVQDIYMAGTSDGVMFLESGRMRQLDGAGARPTQASADTIGRDPE
jgi:hypothetical protein